MPEEEQLYEVTATVVIKVWAMDRDEAKREASKSHANWDDWTYMDTLDVIPCYS